MASERNGPPESNKATGIGDILDNGIQDHVEDIFSPAQELMQYRIRSVLLVASLYDAFILEEDRGLSEKIFGEFFSLGMTSPPRVKLVASVENALAEVHRNKYDLVITMTHLFDSDPMEFGKKVKEIQPELPIVLLVTDAGEIRRYHEPGKKNGIDRVFFWNGDSAIFLAIIKLFEDIRNVENDTRYGAVRVMLLVEDSPEYYSVFLPLMYKEIVRQTQMLIEESVNEQEKMLRKRARPKILLAETYEDAVGIYRQYREYILGVITDVAYPRNGEKDENAGFHLISSIDPDIPVLVQSTQVDKREKAEEFGVSFANKNSETLISEFRHFLKEKLGFGPFVFKLPGGEVVGKASNIKEFIEMIKTVPPESVIYHARKNQFSGWLLARGEIEFARQLRPKKISDFRDGGEMRTHLIDIFEEIEKNKSRGVISDFSSEAFAYENTITRFGGGSLGGKGRGIAFLEYLFQKTGFPKRYGEYGLNVPSAFIIATDEFDTFIEDNGLGEIRNKGLTDREIKKVFLDSGISKRLEEALKKYLTFIREPIAVRSSSLLEDSYSQPFAGIYSTYLLPNNEKSDYLRLKHLSDAIKLVYASTYFKRSRGYIKTTLHTTEDDKMAVVIQKLVGNRFGDAFYPIFSGVAQSYNFYPQPPLKREDGIVNLAMGLGKIVVEGENFLTFSPRRPRAILGFSNTKEILQNSQNIFYAMNMTEENFDLSTGEDSTIKKLYVSDAETDDGVMEWVGSIYDPQNDILRDGSNYEGYRIITFARILKYDRYPLAEILKDILALCQTAMGGAVEIEFAAHLNGKGRPELHILQIRPLLTMKRQIDVEDFNSDNREKYLIYSTKSLGNGVLSNIKDIVFVHKKRFDRGKTVEIAKEIGRINETLDERPYILIGPGRWGTKDRWLGIPVEWEQISNTRTMVETPMGDIKVDYSQGSHFLHNIACLNIPYLTVTGKASEGFIDWDWLESKEPFMETEHVVHLQLENAVEVRVNGNSGRGAVLKGDEK